MHLFGGHSVSITAADSWAEIIIYNWGTGGWSRLAWWFPSASVLEAVEPGQTFVMLCRASQQVGPHLKRLGVTAPKPPFRSGPRYDRQNQKRQRLQPANGAEPRFLPDGLRKRPPGVRLLHTPQASGCQAWNSARLRRSWMGSLVIFICPNRVARPPTIQHPLPSTSCSILLKKARNAVAAEELWPYCVAPMVQLQHAVPIRQIIQKTEVNLLWFYGFLLSLGSWEFLDDSQSVYSAGLL